MWLEAVRQASEEFDQAKEALLYAGTQTQFDPFYKGWKRMLTHLNDVYEKLSEGARKDNKAGPWFGNETRFRKKDKLLQWLHQAANSEKHGLSPSVELIQGRQIIEFEAGEKFTLNKHFVPKPFGLKLAFENWDLSSIPANRIKTTHAVPILKTVRSSRYGDEFAPPKTHCELPITETHPIKIAELGLVYVEDMLWRAVGFRHQNIAALASRKQLL